MADVGLGVSQVLPVLVALWTANPGQLVLVEQPETHLHPRAQVAIAGPILAAVNRGVEVIVETHSAALLRSIQTEIARDAIAPEFVSLNWFSRSSANGMTTITPGKLDERGRFGEWPEDFDDVTLEIEDAYLNAASRTN